MILKVHHFASLSTANGPGMRAVIWLQGCPFSCPGCFNPETHDPAGGIQIASNELAEQINALPVRGITLSGGEPLQQAKAVAELLRALDSDKDVLVYSGFSLAEAVKTPERRSVLLRCDAALMGRYRKGSNHPYENKELVIRTGRILPDEIKPQWIVELIVSGHKKGLATGFLPF